MRRSQKKLTLSLILSLVLALITGCELPGDRYCTLVYEYPLTLDTTSLDLDDMLQEEKHELRLNEQPVGAGCGVNHPGFFDSLGAGFLGITPEGLELENQALVRVRLTNCQTGLDTVDEYVRIELTSKPTACRNYSTFHGTF